MPQTEHNHFWPILAKSPMNNVFTFHHKPKIRVTERHTIKNINPMAVFCRMDMQPVQGIDR